MAGFFSNLLGAAKADGSAFVKLAEADSSELEAKGRIVALDAAHSVKTEVVDFLEKEVDRVHATADVLNTRFKSVLGKL